MSLARLVDELQGLVEDEDSILIIDVNNLLAMNARLKQVRDQAAKFKKEEDRLKRSILAHPDCKVGYSDDFIKVDPKEDFQEDEILLAMLKKKGVYESVSSPRKISVVSLRAAAEEDEDIKNAITWLTSRKLTKRRTKRRAP